MKKKPSAEIISDDKEEMKSASAYSIRTERLLPDVITKINRDTRPIENLIKQKKQQIKVIVESAINKKFFHEKINEIWKILLKRSVPGRIFTEDFLDDIMKADATRHVKRIWQDSMIIEERRFFVWQVHHAVSGDPKLASNKEYRIYFFYLWFDKIKQKKIVKQIEELTDSIFSLYAQIREIWKRIEADHGFIFMHPPGPVTVMKMELKQDDVFCVSFETAMHNLKQKPWYDKEYDITFDNFLNFKSDTMLYLQIDTTYDKKEILHKVDDLISAIQRLQGRQRGRGTRKSTKKEELELLIEDMFIRLYVREKKTEEESINVICAYLESIRNPIEAESLLRNQIRRIKEKNEVKNVKELRNIK